MACPDGCGSILTVNLDPRAGKAWRLYDRGAKTLFPSVWRDSGCQSHFIVWRDRIIWCGVEEWVEDRRSPAIDPRLERDVLGALSSKARTAGDVAEELDAIPYDVEHVLSRLAAAARVEVVAGKPARYRLPTPAREADAPIPPAPAAERPTSWWRRWFGWTGKR